jgi:hypothetical protein
MIFFNTLLYSPFLVFNEFEKRAEGAILLGLRPCSASARGFRHRASPSARVRNISALGRDAKNNSTAVPRLRLRARRRGPMGCNRPHFRRAPSRLEAFFWRPLITGLCAPAALDNHNRRGKNAGMVEISELSRVSRRRRPRPLSELDQTARRVRLQLEEQIFRPRLVPVLLRFTEAQLQRVDDETRVAAYGPPRAGAR